MLAKLMWEEYIAKVLGILIDLDLSFEIHVKMIIEKGVTKVNSYLQNGRYHI